MVKRTISAYQLAIVLLLSKMLRLVLSIPLFTGKVPIGQLVLDELISVLIGLIILIPAIYINSNNYSIKSNLIEKVMYAIYIIFFIGFISITFYDFFQLFGGVVFQGTSALFYSFTMLVVVIYAVKCGIEGIMRTGTVIFILFLISFTFIAVSSFQRINFTNSTIFNGNIISNDIEPYIGSSEYLMFALLARRTKGDIKKAGTLFLIGGAILSFIAIFLVSQVLGEYASYQSNPFFLISSIAEISIFTRLKSVHTAVFTFLIALKLSLLLLCVDESLWAIIQKPKIKNMLFNILAFASIVVVMITCFFREIYQTLDTVLNNILITLIISMSLPLIQIIFMKKNKKELTQS